VSGLALHAEDQQCEREGPYDMTIWTGPEAEKKITLERMLCLHCDRQRKKVNRSHKLQKMNYFSQYL